MFVVVTNRTNIHTKAGGMQNYSAYLMRCLWVLLSAKIESLFASTNLGFVLSQGKDLDIYGFNSWAGKSSD